MWIMTQNRKRIISTEGLDEIYIADPFDGKTDYAVLIHRKTDGKPIALGFYSKLERGKEVLYELMKVQKQFFSFRGGEEVISGGVQPGYVVVPPKVYEMPTE